MEHVSILSIEFGRGTTPRSISTTANSREPVRTVLPVQGDVWLIVMPEELETCELLPEMDPSALLTLPGALNPAEQACRMRDLPVLLNAAEIVAVVAQSRKTPAECIARLGGIVRNELRPNAGLSGRICKKKKGEEGTLRPLSDSQISLRSLRLFRSLI